MKSIMSIIFYPIPSYSILVYPLLSYSIVFDSIRFDSISIVRVFLHTFRLMLKTCATFPTFQFSNLVTWTGHLRFPGLAASYMYFLCILIGSLYCFGSFWLVFVILRFSSGSLVAYGSYQYKFIYWPGFVCSLKHSPKIFPFLLKSHRNRLSVYKVDDIKTKRSISSFFSCSRMLFPICYTSFWFRRLFQA